MSIADEFLNISSGKYTPTAPDIGETKKWADKLKENTGWSVMETGSAVTRLKSIYRDKKRLEKAPEKQKGKIQEQINTKMRKFQEWAESPGIIKKAVESITPAPFSEKIKEISDKDLKEMASRKPVGADESSWNQTIKAAKEELKRRVGGKELFSSYEKGGERPISLDFRGAPTPGEWNSDTLKSVQKQLKDAGFNIKSDGKLGNKTMDAIFYFGKKIKDMSLYNSIIKSQIYEDYEAEIEASNVKYR